MIKFMQQKFKESKFANDQLMEVFKNMESALEEKESTKIEEVKLMEIKIDQRVEKVIA